MTFSEKLFKLRKEKGLSQEALAEKVNTTRQAVSKWENGQGFPETEKLLMIGNIFEVSIDYLLKDTHEQNIESEKGYYVSKEMAEGYLLCEHKTAKSIALGICLLILSAVPYFIFKQSPTIYLPLIIVIATLGIATLVRSSFIEEDKYKILKKETLIFDPNHLKELQDRYNNVRKKYATLILTGLCSLVVGALPLLLNKKELITSEVVTPYYPLCVFFIAVGSYILIHTLSILEAYEVLAKNEEYTNKLGFKLLKRTRKKLNDF